MKDMPWRRLPLREQTKIVGGEMRNTPIWSLLMALPVVVPLCRAAQPTQTRVALPRGAGAEVPLYPPLARVAHVEGVVHVTVTTDGSHVASTRATDGPETLAVTAEENARTWRFASHESTTFTVTYNYRLVPGLKGDPDNGEVILRLPTEVEISISPWPLTGDPSPDKR